MVISQLKLLWEKHLENMNKTWREIDNLLLLPLVTYAVYLTPSRKQASRMLKKWMFHGLSNVCV
jgi:hypothetical protein